MEFRINNFIQLVECRVKILWRWGTRSAVSYRIALVLDSAIIPGYCYIVVLEAGLRKLAYPRCGWDIIFQIF